MENVGSYREYVRLAIENFARKDAERRYLLVNAVKDKKVERVLDIGCGAGQELLPFLEKTEAFCVGLDAAEEFGEVGTEFFAAKGFTENFALIRSQGEKLPFEEESFDVVLCRVALPYMNNRRTIAEIARIMRSGGVFLLKTHAPAFYFVMLWQRLKTFNPKQIAYPLICLTGSVWHQFTGRQLQKGFWKGKEVFQTERFLEKEFEKHGLRIEGFLSDTNPQTPSFVVVKI
ncbi:MAG TPA: class I SAM-dependent methyltransferase [Pyrinomonadaceae bacterium]|nr:class I SAM-dependent methyltransferase [Pyrinomonadaceae bacterium]